jgi:hypothetical protein
MSLNRETSTAAHFRSIVCRASGATLLTILAWAAPAWAQAGHFPDARESNEKLMSLYDDAADLCVRNPNRDVEVAVACQSMAIYGMALNERGMCLGKKGEANAMHKWHACTANSMRFSAVELSPNFE